MFKKFAETSMAGMAIGTFDGKLVYANQAIADMVDVDDPSTEYGREFLRFYKEEIRNTIITEVIPVTVAQGQWKGELDMVNENGTIVHTYHIFSLIRDDKGNPHYLTSAVTDITERKNTEEELRIHREHLEDLVEERTANLLDANNKLNVTLSELERSNTELEQFAYVASHDLQEPLRKIKNFAELLEMQYKDRLDDKANKYIKYMVSGASRMQTLISDLLTFSRITTRDKTIKRMNLGKPCKLAIDNLETLIHENNAKISYEKLPEVKADETQMIQLFQNLVGNAIKFRNENSPEIQISSKNIGNEWIISVKDNGIGIEEEYQNKVFEVFQRLHTKEKYPGTGIGLAVCKKIVEQLGGRLWFESKHHEGTIFHFTIPALNS
jgi:PAS domain S-box-containing protein